MIKSLMNYTSKLIFQIFIGFSMLSIVQASEILPLYDLLDPERIAENEAALNDNLDALWFSKEDVEADTNQLNAKRYTIINLLDPEEAERNAAAINGNFTDLWQTKSDTGNAPGYQRYLVTPDMLTDRSKSEELTALLMQLFYDLEYTKKDRS